MVKYQEIDTRLESSDIFTRTYGLVLDLCAFECRNFGALKHANLRTMIISFVPIEMILEFFHRNAGINLG